MRQLFLFAAAAALLSGCATSYSPEERAAMRNYMIGLSSPDRYAYPDTTPERFQCQTLTPFTTECVKR